MKFLEQFSTIQADTFLEDYLRFNGIQEVSTFLNPTNQLYESPTGFLNIDKAYDQLLEYAGKKVFFLVDCDFDGFAASAIILNFVKQGLDIEPYILLHQGKEHGLTDSKIMEEIKENSEDIDLLVITDAGSNDITQCQDLIENNYLKDIVILDHHLIQKSNSFATVVNNQSKFNTNISNTALSGAGVTYKFIEYFLIQQGVIGDKESEELFRPMLKSYKELVAFSIIGDVCDITQLENRIFIEEGLKNLSNECLDEMWRGLSTAEDLVPGVVAWDIVPKINALCRGNDQELKMQLILALSGMNPEINYSVLLKDLKAVHRQQNEVVKKIAEQHKEITTKTDKIIVIEDDSCPRGMTGLVANKLMSKVQKPILFVHPSEEYYMGSCRSPVPINKILNKSGLFEYNAGHAGAFGTKFKQENLEKIIEFGNTLDLNTETEYNVIKTYTAKSKIPIELFHIGDRYKNLWGQGIPHPMFGIKNVKINGKDIQELGRNRTTIKFKSGNLEFIKHYVSGTIRKDDMFVGEDKDMIWNIVGKLIVNEWNGEVTPQVLIEDFELVENIEEDDWRSAF